MSSARISALASNQMRFLTSITVLGYGLMLSASAMAEEVITMEVESQLLDLDAATVVDSVIEGLTVPAGADVRLAYNADRTPHAVAVPMTEGVGMSFVASVGFDGISSADIPNLVFSTEPTDLPFSPDHCIVIRTDQGAVFKLGNATETDMSVTFNIERL